MKKINYLMGLGLFAASLGVQAQTTIVSLGFEDGDTKYTTGSAYTPGGTYGNWVNQKDGDEWTESYTDDVHSGSKAMQFKNNPETDGSTWERGFWVGNLELKDNTAYRVSYWVKADDAFNLRTNLAVGREYCDMAICAKNGVQYIYNLSKEYSSNWQHISFITFFTNKEDQDAWSMNYTGKEDPNGNIPVPQGDPFPNEYYLEIQAYSPVTYLLDDIKIEEGVAFNEATFSDDVIKLDFGYSTNIADLAKEQGGNLSLDPSCVSVTVDGQAVTPDYFEGKSDGFLYIFFNETVLESAKEVIVSFTPAADCPIVYNSDKRPSADVESEMKVLGFTNEVAYRVDYIDAVSSAWSEPVFVTSTPENGSFNLDAADVKTVIFTYNKPIDCSSATATLTWKNNFGEQEEDLSENLKADGSNLIITLPADIEDGEYNITVVGVANELGFEQEIETTITLQIGEDTSTETEAKTIYASDFDHEMTDGIPRGWYTYNEAGEHIFGYNDPETQTSQYNYGWGGNNPLGAGGGTRLFEGFSGDFSKAMYWGTRGTNEGYAEYGSLVKRYMNEDGTFDPNMPEGIELKLEPRKYQISFLMAAWKGEPTFTFTLEDLNGTVYAEFKDILASPNVNGQKIKVTNSVKCVTDFTVDKEGYYVLKFTSCEAQWQEFLLANVKLITMPSKGAYYGQLLRTAAAEADSILALAVDPIYDGATKTALAAAINSARNDKFTSPSAVEGLIESLETLSEAILVRMENIDNFSNYIAESQAAYDALDEKYQNAQICKDAMVVVAQYATVDPSTLEDADLNAAVAEIKGAKDKLVSAQNTIDILTWGAQRAAITAYTFGEDGSPADDLVEDNRAVINDVNGMIKKSLYEKIVANENLSDYKSQIYDMNTAVEEIPAGKEDQYDEDGHPLVVEGIDLSCYVWNSHLYIENGQKNPTGWMVASCDTNEVNISYSATPSETSPVVDTQINIYGNTNYDMSQRIENLPAGIYAVTIQTRTPKKLSSWSGLENDTVYYNAQDENGVWDKYIYAQGDANDAQLVAPFAGADGLTPTLIRNVKVGADGVLDLGVHEFYVSGKARKWDQPAEQETDATDYWLGTTYVDYVNVYFVEPLPGYDYAQALTAVKNIASIQNATVTDIYSVSGARLSGLQKGINIVKYSNGAVRKQIVK